MTDEFKGSPYVHRTPRALCPVCRERPARPETEVCEPCELKAQANVVDLDANDIKAWGG